MKDLEARKRHIETELARAIEEERVRGFLFVLGGCSSERRHKDRRA
jgi:hypothetical protein